MAFHIPEGWERFFEEVQQQTIILIDRKVLEGIKVIELKRWLANFETDEEKYLAAHLLRALIYRSNAMLKVSCQQIATFVLPNLIERKRDATIDEFLVDLCSESNPLKVIFAPVEPSKRSDNTTDEMKKLPGKSGQSILRMLIKEIGLHENSTIHVDESEVMPRDIKYLIFVDDMCGTGKQFCSFYRDYKLENVPTKKIFIPLFAHEKGIKRIHDNCPDVTVSPVEVLTSKNNFFRAELDSGQPPLWALDQSNTVHDVKAFYKSLLKRYEIEIGSPFGFGGLGLTFFSSESTHNNGLHIFYTNLNSKNWKPLLKR